MCSNAGYAMSGSRTTVASARAKDFQNESDAYDFFGASSPNGGMYPDWINNTSQKQRDDVSWYTGGAYEAFNKALRTDQVLSSYYKQKLMNMKNAINKFDLKEDLKVYRGSSAHLLGGLTDPDEINSILKGKTVRDKGFTSTSAVKGHNFDGEIEYHITVRAGKGKGAFIAPISNFKTEAEFLLKNGTEFKVLGARKHPTSSHKTIVELEC